MYDWPCSCAPLVCEPSKFLVLVLFSAGVTEILSWGTSSDLKYRENHFECVDFFFIIKMNDRLALHISYSNGSFQRIERFKQFIYKGSNKNQRSSKRHSWYKYDLPCFHAPFGREPSKFSCVGIAFRSCHTDTQLWDCQRPEIQGKLFWPCWFFSFSKWITG